ncbi:hypothetical protein BT93_L0659 [Corymbia citriodora subsp. variegata]|uniref:Protein kinase domain-containing protein n=1 Tax=Corymbia citriodora subsp. variegata TaxID=360336 RepID=A0A8T0CTS7_CORYI|nr:hypothetical protein BT93_L0659 [Corymbia citriodora subsp. variegata]
MGQDQLLALFHLLLLHQCFSMAVENNQCSTSCGEYTYINYPFRLRNDPKACGHSSFELDCINNRTILNFNSGSYFVHDIDYMQWTIRVADVGLQVGNSSSLPLRSLSSSDFPYTQDSYYLDTYSQARIVIVGCTKAINSPLYIDASLCRDGLQFSNSSNTRRRVYAMIDGTVSSMETSCTIELVAMVSADHSDLRSYAQIHEQMAYGFMLHWYPLKRKDGVSSAFNVYWGIWRNSYYDVMVMLFSVVLACMVVKFILGAPCVMIFLIRKWRRRHLAMDQNVEEFLQSNNNFLPIRYSYSDIKKITGGLKEKLGEGGYGSVFKGRLRSGHDVAVKILKKGKANGQDFISEVATIGRIHHVNVVGLIGFCFEGSKQALVYDFMHNGSLDKHIFSQGEETSLDSKEVYKIALGVARGIEYLHRGCNMQILHFDIKPHNILLDKDLTPKVSDFGLARLYSPDHNTVSLTAARGTLGYMAPELVYKNIGGISYKADVYSFGKLLMEMASRRKNSDAVTGYSSQIYIPLWVHDHLSEGSNVPMEEVSEEDQSIVKKMMIVALWCIQLNPRDRPSMRKVLEILEGEADDLQVPPKPLFCPTEMSIEIDGTWTDEGNDTISTSSTNATTYEAFHVEHTSISIRQA